jgi:hypothetical protein
MLLNPNIQLAIPEMDNLFPRQPDDFRQGNAEEALHSHLIIGFEEALPARGDATALTVPSAAIGSPLTPRIESARSFACISKRTRLHPRHLDCECCGY